jgi:hypothetical protein
MMRSKRQRFLAALGMIALSVGGTARASVPPPPPEFVDAIARQLEANPTAATFDSYAALFADDLIVTFNGRTVAHNKTEWLAIERSHLGHSSRFVYGFSADPGSILMLDRFDETSDEHCPAGQTCLFDPRWVARAFRYEIGPDHLIHAIRILQTNSILQPGH